MKVKVISNFHFAADGEDAPIHHIGEVFEVADDVAERLVKRSLAVPAEVEAKPKATRKRKAKPKE